MNATNRKKQDPGNVESALHKNEICIASDILFVGSCDLSRHFQHIAQNNDKFTRNYVLAFLIRRRSRTQNTWFVQISNHTWKLLCMSGHFYVDAQQIQTGGSGFNPHFSGFLLGA